MSLSIITSSVVLSAIVAGLIALLSGYFQRKADVKAKTRELALTLALDEWRHHCKIAEGGKVGVGSPDAYLYRYHQILTAMQQNELTPEKIVEIQKDVMSLSLATQAATEEFRKTQNLPAPFE